MNTTHNTKTKRLTAALGVAAAAVMTPAALFAGAGTAQAEPDTCSSIASLGLLDCLFIDPPEFSDEWLQQEVNAIDDNILGYEDYRGDWVPGTLPVTEEPVGPPETAVAQVEAPPPPWNYIAEPPVPLEPLPPPSGPPYESEPAPDDVAPDPWTFSDQPDPLESLRPSGPPYEWAP